MLVRVLKYWSDLDLLRQTPGGKGEWNGINFIIDEPGEADYVIVSCYAGETCRVQCPRENLWLFMGEPPNEIHKQWHHPPKWFSRIYTTDETISSRRHYLRPPILPWHVNRSYDFLTSCTIPEKPRKLSWITSNRTDTAGHVKRLKVIEQLRQLPDLDLYGRGYNPIEDKWDGLAPYRYSIAYENFSNANYWTEKLMDCFLSWTMPIYYGCTDLERFFPKRSFVRIDPDSSDLTKRVAEIIESDLWRENADAIEEARDLVLHKYNFFEVASQEIMAQKYNSERRKQNVTVYNHCIPARYRMKMNLSASLKKYVPSIHRLLASQKRLHQQ